jgi:hypothetical protein
MIFAPNTILPAGTDHPAQPPPPKLNNADVATPYPGKAVTSTGAEPSALKSKTQTVVAPGSGAGFVGAGFVGAGFVGAGFVGAGVGGAGVGGVAGASSLVIVPTTAPEVPIV